MSSNARIEPCGRIAKALAQVVAPLRATPGGRRSQQRLLAPLGRPAEFPPRITKEFTLDQLFVGSAIEVTQPHPCEMKQFMHQYPRQLSPIAAQLNVENNRALS